MIFGKNKTTAALFIAASITVSALLSGCGNASAKAAVSPEAREIADEYFAGDKSSFPTWADIDTNKVVASVDEPEHIPFFDIKFGDFIGEYMYYLINYGIEDDMSAENAEACKSYRVNIINYLTFEKMYLYTAAQDYGITPETLTAEQLDTVCATADAVREDWEMSFYNAASEKLGENASEEDVEKLCSEALDVILEKCGINYDMFYEWEMNSFIQELTLEKMLEANAGISEEELKKETDSVIEQAKNAAETDPSTYEATPSYQFAYVPAGTRKARHILINFPEETVNAVYDAREKGNDYEADKLRLDALDGGLRAKAEEIAKKLTVGADFDELANEYTGEGEHIVLRNSQSYSEEYIGAVYGIAEKGAVADLLITDRGIYIIQYTDDAKSNTDQLTEQIRAYLKNKGETNVQIDEYNKWTEKYVYNVDCETLKVDEEEIIRYGSAFSDITS
ncbi:MAG: hypothetical protein IJU82_02270 [Ruminiclostridium sp.]|nr:hypothetical protein [Ruminiclostridium sp.]